MELGFGRFLEIFEERFGRVATNLLMAMLALAAVSWAIQTTVEMVVYVHRIAKSVDFVAALMRESAAAHLVFFAAQLAGTFIAMWLIWKWFLRRKLRGLMESLDAKMAEVRNASKEFDEAMAKYKTARTLIQQAEDAFGKLHDAVKILKDHPVKPPPDQLTPDAPKTGTSAPDCRP